MNQFKRRVDTDGQGHFEISLHRLVCPEDVLIEEGVTVEHWDGLQDVLGNNGHPTARFGLSPADALNLADALVEAARRAEAAFQERAGLR